MFQTCTEFLSPDDITNCVCVIVCRIPTIFIKLSNCNIVTKQIEYAVRRRSTCDILELSSVWNDATYQLFNYIKLLYRFNFLSSH